MAVKFKDSKTKENLMRAFAGESQARNRYTFGAQKAKEKNLKVVADVFEFTAGQEKEHAEIFYNHLSELAGETIAIDGAYPIDLSEDVEELLRMAQHNEYEEHDDVYQAFGTIAKEEGFHKVATDFFHIAKIEKTHGDRFGKLADYMKEDKLFQSEEPVSWMCLNCGYIYEGTKVPEQCPVCYHDKGYFVRLEMAPFE
ncbi:rubrerythrin [Velocimicrobium porci]|uniref:Rubrerythrin family protein n=1 Tax=Velocimicrobium porci TaxID=2606634 RepID=A0A6L5XV11_9FIRM|nr:rubrerythrin family protein [Velocimicrobium porci]MSS62439.1 rubrerythrin family protein [Velocimicrobium porci]